MQESVLRHYFTGECTVQDLKADLSGAVKDHRLYEVHPIKDMESCFQVTSAHLAGLCDEVLGGTLAPTDLEPIGICLAASDHFVWSDATEDGERVSLTVFDWSAPEQAYPLSRENVVLFRQRLLMGGDPFRR